MAGSTVSIEMDAVSDRFSASVTIKVTLNVF